MYDYKLGIKCDHMIFDEEVTINGASPSYYSLFTYPCSGSTNLIEVREYGATDGLTNYSYAANGIANWALSTSSKITFNTNGLSGVPSMVDGNTNFNPPKRYFITYPTTLAACPKCLGAGVVADVGFDVIGQILLVTGREKLKQQVRKILLTQLSSNEFYKTYGSQLQEIIGKKMNLYAQLLIQEYIRNALENLRTIQALEVDLPLSEKYLRISKLTIAVDSADPRQINVDLEIMNAEYQTTTTGVVYKI